jgi:hypothetical protein
MTTAAREKATNAKRKRIVPDRNKNIADIVSKCIPLRIARLFAETS